MKKIRLMKKTAVTATVFGTMLITGCFVYPLTVLGATVKSDLHLLKTNDSYSASVVPSHDVESSSGINVSGSVFDSQMKPPPSYRDWEGLRRDTGYFIFYQWAVIGVLYVSPESVSRWSSDDKKNFSIKQWKEKMRYLVWDKDDLIINYVLHPYWGATYYVRAQNRGFGSQGSFWYAVSLSTIYEITEAIAEYPSIQDMIATPVLGSLLGNYFMDVRKRIRERKQDTGKLSGTDNFLLIATDPLGALNVKMDQWLGLGKSATTSFQPVVGPMITPISNYNTLTGELDQTFMVSPPVLGIRATIHW